MIGHWLVTLTQEQEALVLTRPMWDYDPALGRANQCLVQVVYGIKSPFHAGRKFFRRQALVAPARGRRLRPLSIAEQYDALCARFGLVRVNAAIRYRVLSNQARRVLQVVYESA